MAVVLGHVGVAASNANYAVICFFVLSGFLITHLLVKEFDKTGDVSLRRFYGRRALRIFRLSTVMFWSMSSGELLSIFRFIGRACWPA